MKWFKRQPKNRKLRNTHVLDVKLRADQIRASRMRLAAIALSFTFATVFGFYLLWRTSQFVLDRFIYENAAFAVQQIDVQTDGVIAPAQLRRWAGVKIGDNLMALDLARVKRDLEMVSVIRTVAVERMLPHTLRLRVSERNPIAQISVPLVRTNGTVEIGTLHVDAEGSVMTLIDPRLRAVPLAQTNDTLPAIIGLNQTDLLPGRRLDSAQARSALQLISAFAHSPMAHLAELDTIDVSSPEILQVKTRQGNQVTFSLRDFPAQLRYWREIRDEGLRFGKVIATLDLSVKKNIPARWTDAATPPSAVPANRNTQRNRKKNV
jgi:cell division septal protein FtsQ